MKFRILPEARAELLHAAEYYEQQRAALGEEFLDAVTDAFDTIRNHPRLSPKIGGIGSRREYRGFLLHRFPYQVVYLLRPDEVVVFAIAHTSRRPGFWRDRGG